MPYIRSVFFCSLVAAFARTIFLTMCIVVYVCQKVDIVVTAKQTNSATWPGDGLLCGFFDDKTFYITHKRMLECVGCRLVGVRGSGFGTSVRCNCLLFVSTVLLLCVFFLRRVFFFFFLVGKWIWCDMETDQPDKVYVRSANDGEILCRCLQGLREMIFMVRL